MARCYTEVSLPLSEAGSGLILRPAVTNQVQKLQSLKFRSILPASIVRGPAAPRVILESFSTHHKASITHLVSHSVADDICFQSHVRAVPYFFFSPKQRPGGKSKAIHLISRALKVHPYFLKNAKARRRDTVTSPGKAARPQPHTFYLLPP